MPAPSIVYLSDCRRALEDAGLTTYDAWALASDEQLRALGAQRDQVARFLATNRPDIIRALFGEVRWRADADMHGTRLAWLQVDLPLDAPDVERRLFAALTAAIGTPEADLPDAGTTSATART